jgi:hypothetical protein
LQRLLSTRTAKAELRVRDRTAVAVDGCQLLRLHLAESVERLNAGELIHTEKVRMRDPLNLQACHDVGEHGLVKEARVKPQHDALIILCTPLAFCTDSAGYQEHTLSSARLPVVLSRNRARALRVSSWGHPGISGAVVEDVVPYEYFA